ncbi:hypothetical protein SAMN05428966_115156 [Massilia sp. PDC64]|nr:hypothetical protein SAMN05428966_115156 [Massilia sp. PDC64]
MARTSRAQPAAKPAVKTATKPAAKKAAAPAGKTAAVKKAAPAKPVRAKAAPTPAKAAQQAARAIAAPAKSTRTKAAPVPAPVPLARPRLVRDSFTMPEQEYAVLATVKQACLKAGFEVKKSELLRIGVALLGQLDTASLRAVLDSLPQLKTGRPPGE